MKSIIKWTLPIVQQIDIAYCSAVWAALFQYSALNQLSAGKQNSDVDSAIILCSLEHLLMGAMDSDFIMKADYAYPTSPKRGDIAVASDTVDWYQRSDLMLKSVQW